MTNENTPTPRTDAVQYHPFDNMGGDHIDRVVDADFVRQLERELTVSNTALGTATVENVKLKWELAALKGATDDLKIKLDRVSHAVESMMKNKGESN